MMSLSLMTIPVFLDTNTQPAQMLHQWVRLYHYGHLLLPSMSVATLSLYLYVALNNRASGALWASYATAGAVTVAIIPFTLIVMVPTNNTLFELEDLVNISAAVPSLDYVRELVTKWGRMHLVRSLFPLLGATLGFNALYEDVAIGHL
jgi:hypothetical protein